MAVSQIEVRFNPYSSDMIYDLDLLLRALRQRSATVANAFTFGRENCVESVGFHFRVSFS